MKSNFLPESPAERRICGVRLRRLNQIDYAIRSGTYPNCTSLAKTFKVNSRTILRDIALLQDEYAAPIAFNAQKNGYYYTDPDFYFKSFRLTEGELFSLALFDRLLEQYRNTPLEESLRTVFAKIASSLPETVTFDSQFLKAHTTFISDAAALIATETFQTVFSALKNHHTLSFEYRPLQKTTYLSRSLDPYHAVCQKGNWYVIGFCHDKNEVRIFSFSRMQKATETTSRFTLPENFKPQDYFDKELGVWLSAKNRFTVELLAAAEIGTYAMETKWNDAQEIHRNDDGTVRVRFETTQLPEVKRWVLGQGATVRVLQPPQLIEEIKAETKKILQIYEKKVFPVT